uniref:Putative chaperonin n=1 Tax=viral metagenome TaxID=1070528 RepID=A0A6M3KX89_9ZZZZ
MTIIPMGARVYLRLDAVEEKMIGRLYVPDKSSQPIRVGTVQAVGSDVTLFKPGDKVLVSYMAGLIINPLIDGFSPEDDTHRVMTEGEIPVKLGE